LGIDGRLSEFDTGRATEAVRIWGKLIVTDDKKYAEDSITLLVLERGAEWPSWGTGIRLRAPNSAVEVQTETETTEEFQRRVEHRLARIAQQSLHLVAAGYACALDDGGRQLSRKNLCTRILTGLSDTDGAELILAGGAWETAGEEGLQRARLIELWGELSIQVPGRLTSVRFEDPPSHSGVFRAAQDVRAVNARNTLEYEEPVPSSRQVGPPESVDSRASDSHGSQPALEH
jgi:hypothetical protein